MVPCSGARSGEVPVGRRRRPAERDRFRAPSAAAAAASPFLPCASTNQGIDRVDPCARAALQHRRDDGGLFQHQFRLRLGGAFGGGGFPGLGRARFSLAGLCFSGRSLTGLCLPGGRLAGFSFPRRSFAGRSFLRGGLNRGGRFGCRRFAGRDLGLRRGVPGRRVSGRFRRGCVRRRPGCRLGLGLGLRLGFRLGRRQCRRLGLRLDFRPRGCFRRGLGLRFRRGFGVSFGLRLGRRFGPGLGFGPRGCVGGRFRRRLGLRLGRRGRRLRLGDQFADVLFDVAGVDVALARRETPGQRPQERDVAGDAHQAEIAQRAARLLGGGGQGVGVHDHLGQQGVVADAGLVAGIAEAVDADAGARRRLVGLQHPAARLRLSVGVHGLEIDPRLDGDADRGRDGALLAKAHAGQRRAAGDLELQPHQVEPSDAFGHGVLHLQPRVGLDEGVARFALGLVDQELERAEALVPRCVGHLHRRGLQRGAHGVIDADRRGDLDQLLALALQAALAVPEVDHGPGPVADDLHLDVASPGEEPFDVEPAVAERRLGFGGAARERLGEVRGTHHRPHAAPAAAGQRLEHHRAAVAQGGEEGAGFVQRGPAAGAGQGGDVQPAGQAQRRGLVAEQGEGRGGGADEGQPGVGAILGEGRVLAEEAVAGMHRVAAALLRQVDNLRHVEVGGGAGPLQRDHGGGAPRVQRVGVVLGVHRDGGDAHLRGGAGDADGDLATVGDQQLFQRISLGARRTANRPDAQSPVPRAPPGCVPPAGARHGKTSGAGRRSGTAAAG